MDELGERVCLGLKLENHSSRLVAYGTILHRYHQAVLHAIGLGICTYRLGEQDVVGVRINW